MYLCYECVNDTEGDVGGGVSGYANPREYLPKSYRACFAPTSYGTTRPGCPSLWAAVWKKIDKMARLYKRYGIATHEDLPYFTDGAGVMLLAPTQLIEQVGDHDLLLGAVTWSKNLCDRPILTTTYLREHKFTR